MVSLNKIYTKTGDDGSTSLIGGVRISKNALRLEVMGTVDEANAAIGMARLHASKQSDAMLERIQHDLFDLGADLATPEQGDNDLRIIPAQTSRLENEIDRLNQSLESLTSFVLPGGTAAAANLHLARTIVRRAERLAVALAGEVTLNSELITYLNRLSDHLFVLARTENSGDDVLWKAGVNR